MLQRVALNCDEIMNASDSIIKTFVCIFKVRRERKNTDQQETTKNNGKVQPTEKMSAKMLPKMLQQRQSKKTYMIGYDG